MSNHEPREHESPGTTVDASTRKNNDRSGGRPECPLCDTDLLVRAYRSRDAEHICTACGSTLDSAGDVVDEGNRLDKPTPVTHTVCRTCTFEEVGLTAEYAAAAHSVANPGHNVATRIVEDQRRHGDVDRGDGLVTDGGEEVDVADVGVPDGEGTPLGEASHSGPCPLCGDGVDRGDGVETDGGVELDEAYRSVNAGSTGGKLHRDEDCRALKTTSSRPVDLDTLPPAHRDWCPFCDSEEEYSPAEPSGKGGGTRKCEECDEWKPTTVVSDGLCIGCRFGPDSELDRGDGLATDGGEILACPVCDSAKIRTTGRGRLTATAEADYRCASTGCGWVGDTPASRKPKGHRDTRPGLAGRLSKADPDDVGEDNPRLVTDGGAVRPRFAFGKHLDLGETLVGRSDSPVAGRVSGVEPGRESYTVEVGEEELVEAVTRDLADSYPSVFLWSNGHALAVTDHKSPIGGADVPSLVMLSAGVHREEVVDADDDAAAVMVRRSIVSETIDEVPGSGPLAVHVDGVDRPVVFERGGEGVAIAPRVPREDVEDGGGR